MSIVIRRFDDELYELVPKHPNVEPAPDLEAVLADPKIHYSPGHEELWGWFSLSYASWLTLPRVLMHAMPDDWQMKMAELLREWDDTWKGLEDVSTGVTMRRRNRFIRVPHWISNYRHPDGQAIEEFRNPKP